MEYNHSVSYEASAHGYNLVQAMSLRARCLLRSKLELKDSLAAESTALMNGQISSASNAGCRLRARSHYLGFPFLIMQEARATTRPRIAPILLWPVRLVPEVGARGRISLSFDRDREEVRLNPAFETLLGMDQATRWREKANELLVRWAYRSSGT